MNLVNARTPYRPPATTTHVRPAATLVTWTGQEASLRGLRRVRDNGRYSRYRATSRTWPCAWSRIAAVIARPSNTDAGHRRDGRERHSPTTDALSPSRPPLLPRSRARLLRKNTTIASKKRANPDEKGAARGRKARRAGLARPCHVRRRSNKKLSAGCSFRAALLFSSLRGIPLARGPA